MNDMIYTEIDGCNYLFGLHQDQQTMASGVFCTKFFMEDQPDTIYYLFPKHNRKWSCSCPGGTFRKRCKHIDKVKELVSERKLDIVL